MNNPAICGGLGFIIGIILVFCFFVLPQQKLLLKKDSLVNEMQDFNLKEQQRLAGMRNISESQLKTWVSINEEASRKYQEIFNTIQKRERQFSNPGLYLITLMVVFLCILIVFYIWINRNENIKDLATLENFETFIEQRFLPHLKKNESFELIDKNKNNNLEQKNLSVAQIQTKINDVNKN